MSAPPLRSIVLVDDQREIRSIVQLALGKIGRYQLHAFESGALALEAVPQLAPDLLLLDMNMPEMDGLATLAGLRGRGVRAPAIFFTSRVQPADLAEYQAVGAIGTIAKPFDPLKLAAQIQALWKQAGPNV